LWGYKKNDREKSCKEKSPPKTTIAKGKQTGKKKKVQLGRKGGKGGQHIINLQKKFGERGVKGGN